MLRKSRQTGLGKALHGAMRIGFSSWNYGEEIPGLVKRALEGDNGLLKMLDPCKTGVVTPAPMYSALNIRQVMGFSDIAGWLPENVTSVLICEQSSFLELDKIVCGGTGQLVRLVDVFDWFDLPHLEKRRWVHFKTLRDIEDRALETLRNLEAHHLETKIADAGSTTAENGFPLLRRLSLGRVVAEDFGSAPAWEAARYWSHITDTWDPIQKREILGFAVTSARDMVMVWNHALVPSPDGRAAMCGGS